MTRVYVGIEGWDAQMVRDVLEQNDIQALVQPPGYHPREVWILNDEDEARAREVVAAFDVEASKHAKDPGFVWTWRCLRCGETIEPQFSVCWNCGADRPA